MHISSMIIRKYLRGSEHGPMEDRETERQTEFLNHFQQCWEVLKSRKVLK